MGWIPSSDLVFNPRGGFIPPLFFSTTIGIYMKKILLLSVIISSFTFAQSDTIQTDVPALKDVYANDFTIGCLLSYPHIGFPDDPPVPGQSTVVAPNGGYLIQFHMNSMSPGNNMKAQNTVDINASAAAYNAAATQEARDSINVHPVVRFNGNMIAQLNWAQRQSFTFRGHTLVWHNQTPGTAFFRTGYSNSGERLTPELMTERMRNYIKGIIRLLHENWPGMVTAMDVVNEAVADNGTFRTTNNEWYDTFGDNSYVMKAFEFTREATELYGETQIMLYYNDYNTHNSAKADGIVTLLTPIWEAGYLDGIGMQHHDGRTSPAASQFISSYDKFYPICTEMAITELDVNPQSSNITDFILEQQANQYAMLFKLFVERSAGSGRGKIVNVSKDGLNDQYAFVANASLWDANNQVKPAFWAAVNIGIHYNALDSLIAHAETLVENDYTAETWTMFSDSLAAAEAVMAQDFSYMVSAADALRDARERLENAYKGLILTKYTEEPNPVVPESYHLAQNFPNPFNPTTRINYSIPTSGLVSLKVSNLVGQEVATVFEGFQPAGNYTVTFDGTGLASGVYLYRLQVNNFLETKRFVLLR
jgi:endo-1,4-beta-xylanase